MKPFWTIPLVIAGILLVLEIGLRIYVEAPLRTDFYSSLSRADIPAMQAQVGVRAVSGPGWVHLGWVADPQRETYLIERKAGESWVREGEARFGSFLVRGSSGVFRVLVQPRNGQARVLGEVTAPDAGLDSPPMFIPRIAGAWQTLFLPRQYGLYINDHTVFQDAEGNWRLIGITSLTNGDYDREVYFAVGVSANFPPANGMTEQPPVADFGPLAWAPHVIREADGYHMFWSPHQLVQMTSPDGITWQDYRITMPAPYHKFFRDPMVLKVADGQWLLYTTARGAYFSQVDVYQSFDLEHWQYIRTALRSGWGSERNSPFASTESPFVTVYQGRYYLSLTYNNDSFFPSGLLLPFKIWLDPSTYNDTLVFHADNPYDFGEYRGRGRSPSLLTTLTAHAPEIVHHPETDAWYITTAGWPWVSTLTHGEAAVAPLEWLPAP
ncbi:MAG: hypothetical protein WHV44_03745 [Anaerolineales bacterium]